MYKFFNSYRTIQIFNFFYISFGMFIFKGFVYYIFIFRYPLIIFSVSVEPVAVFYLFNPNIVNLCFSLYTINMPYIYN